MKRRTIFLSTAFILIYCGVCPAQIVEVDGVELTTTKAPWKLRIPGNDLDIADVKVKPDEQSAYFMMTSESSKLTVSVFIEPVDKCKTSEECRDYVLNLGNPKWGKFQDLTKSKIKDFSYFEFYRPEFDGHPLKMFDMYVEYVDQGYWVDLHISKALYSKEDHVLFEKVIKAISFVAKDKPVTSTYDSAMADGEKAAATWLGLWDKMKCLESYTNLSQLTRADIPEKLWIKYCQETNDALGQNRSRKLVASAFTKGRPPKTDRPLAILAYHSSFTNSPSGVDLVALLLETNGSWSVTNYLLR